MFQNVFIDGPIKHHTLSKVLGPRLSFMGEQIWYENMLTGSLLGRTLREKNLRKNKSRRGEYREAPNYSSVAEEKTSSSHVWMGHLKCTAALKSCARLWQCRLVHGKGVHLVRPMPPWFLRDSTVGHGLNPSIHTNVWVPTLILI